MVDIHAHLLPQVDDGSRGIDQTLNMARLAVADGISTLVATPHHLNGVFRNPASQVRRHCFVLGMRLADEGIDLAVLPGSECHLVPELPAALAQGTAMTVADRGKAVLVELPVHHVPRGASDILDELGSLGLQPIIAHPERNTQLARDPALLREWVEGGRSRAGDGAILHRKIWPPGTCRRAGDGATGPDPFHCLRCPSGSAPHTGIDVGTGGDRGMDVLRGRRIAE